MKHLFQSLFYHLFLALCIFISGIAVHAVSSAHSEEILPRVIVSVYDSRRGEMPRTSRTQSLAALPLNHLGLIIEHYDMAKGLPDLSNRKDVRGILTWFAPGIHLQDPQAFLAWASKAVDAGKKFVILGDLGFIQSASGKMTPLYEINGFLKKLGLQSSGQWVDATYGYSFIQKDKTMVEFERAYGDVNPPFTPITPVGNEVTSYLVIGKKDQPDSFSHLVLTSPQGGYAAMGYEAYLSDNNPASIQYQWFINPFTFFETAFDTKNLPKPDTTTLAGRRIYYSHVDGDGWNNVSLIENYVKNQTLSSEVILENAVKPYPDLPVTIAPIAAELDPAWAATKEAQDITRKFFALPQVEAGSHTYSHPFNWSFFQFDQPEKERKFLPYYHGKIWDKKQELYNFFASLKRRNAKPAPGHETHDSPYATPRAYAAEPFDLRTEINGSLQTISLFLPKHKKVMLLQWSGDTSLFENAIRLTRQAGVGNINGGDSRFDSEYPSRMWLAGVGIKIGNEVQIYASNSNENTYTNLWTERYHGFRYLQKTVENTESPIRLKPFNIYYHTYSGERDASLRALLSNLDYARTQSLAPIPASQYAAIGQGFFSAQLIELAPQSWRVEKRGRLNTLRFDHAAAQKIDFLHSKGIIGARHYQGSLYVYLDEAVSTPIVTLGALEQLSKEPVETLPYLIQSRWQIRKLTRDAKGFAFTAQGFGKGEMQWSVPQNGIYAVLLNTKKIGNVTARNHLLSFALPETGIDGVTVNIMQP